MQRFPKNSMAAAIARWGSWLIVCMLLWRGGAFVSLAADEAAKLLMLLSYITIYAILWTYNLPQIVTRTNDGSVVIVYDLVLSALPMWFSGGWHSPFLPFALSVLVVPALSRGWRGGSLVAAIFLAVDQVMLWTTRDNPLDIAFSDQQFSLFGFGIVIDGSFVLLCRTFLPFAVVAVVVGASSMRRNYIERRRQQAKRAAPQLHWERATVRSMLDAEDETATTYNPASGEASEPTRLWGKERAGQSTLERKSSATIQVALQQLRAELKAAGVVLSAQIQGDETVVPQQVHALLTKAIEIALDNVISHARAKAVELELVIGGDDAVLTVCDDGIGLYDGTAEPPGFHQLKRLRFRAQELGGTLLVEERPESGVRFELRVPFAI